MSLYRVAVSLGILISISLRFLLPVLDRYAAEHDPWHSHIVIGASDPRQYARALARHQHTSRQRQAASPQPGYDGSPKVYNISSQLDSRATALGMESQPGFLLGSSLVVIPPAGIWQTSWPAYASPSAVDLPHPTPPPRFIS